MSDIYTKIMARIAQEGNCWQWQGATSMDGLPQYGRKKLSVRRFLYERDHGPLKRGKAINMTCGNSQCVNLAHMAIPADHDHKAYLREYVKRKRTIAQWRRLVLAAIERRREAA